MRVEQTAPAHRGRGLAEFQARAHLRSRTVQLGAAGRAGPLVRQAASLAGGPAAGAVRAASCVRTRPPAGLRGRRRRRRRSSPGCRSTCSRGPIWSRVTASCRTKHRLTRSRRPRGPAAVERCSAGFREKQTTSELRADVRVASPSWVDSAGRRPLLNIMKKRPGSSTTFQGDSRKLSPGRGGPSTTYQGDPRKLSPGRGGPSTTFQGVSRKLSPGRGGVRRSSEPPNLRTA